MELLEYLSGKIGCMYLSDLCSVPGSRFLMMKLVGRMKHDDFALADWQNAADYLFGPALRFNEVLDTDRELQADMRALTRQFSEITETEYIDKTLLLFRRVGLALTGTELNQLLACRRQREVDRLGQVSGREVTT